MPPNGFLLAMRPIPAAATRAPVDATGMAPFWLIVSRFGADGRYATISLAAGTTAWGEMAPIGLTPAATLFGERCLKTGFECGFRFAEQLPTGIPVAGRFLPASGVMRLDGGETGMELEAWGKLLDGAEPWSALLPAGTPKGDWHLRAGQRPWVGEFIEPSRQLAN